MSVSISDSSSSYLYIDDSGDIQGPFSQIELREWRQLNYFTDQTLVRRHKEGEDESKIDRSEFKPFGVVLGSTTSTAADSAASSSTPSSTTAPTELAAAAPAAVAEPAVTIEDEDVEMEEAPIKSTATAHVSPSTASTQATAASSPSAVAAAAAAAPPSEAEDAAMPAPASTQWYYLDDSGQEQGPFSSEDMRSWFSADYFNGDTCLRSAEEKECKPFKDRTEQQTTFMNKEGNEADATHSSSTTSQSAAPVTDAREVVNPEDEFEVDEDEYLHDRLMDAEDAEGDEKTATNDDAKDGEDKDEEEGDDDGTEKPSKKRARVASPVAVEALKWYYIDTGEVSHGPYSSWAMLTWHRKGFFAFHDTPLRREDEPVAVPLSKRTEAPSFFRAEAPVSKKEMKARALAEKIAKEKAERKLENRWYYLDAKDVEQGPFTEAQMRGWWEGNFLKPSLRIRQVGEDESDYSTIESRGDTVAFTKPAPAPAIPIMQQQPHPYSMNYPPQPYGAPAAMPYGAAAPYPYAQPGGYAPAAYHNAPHYAAAGGGGSHRAPREDYTQHMGFDRRRGGYAPGRGPPNQYGRR